MTLNIEKQAVAQSFGDAANDYDEYALIQHKIAQGLISISPNTINHSKAILDLGCGTGYCLPLLSEKYQTQNVTGADLSQGMLDYAQSHYPLFKYEMADAENLPFKDNQYDLIFSNFAVQWCDRFSQVLAEIFRCLAPGGKLVLSTLADGTLQELKQAWAQADDYQHVNDFEPASALMNAVDASEFDVALMNTKTEVHYYSTVRALTDSLKRIGAHNITSGRAKALTSPGTIKKFSKALESFRTEQGLPASYEVFTCVLSKPKIIS